MMHRAAVIILFALTCSAFGQTPFQGLTAGQSTREDVERVMGQPVKQISQTLSEYQPNEDLRRRLVTKVYVQYRKASTIVERIEALASRPFKRSDVLANLHLPQKPIATNTDANGRFLEYFGAPSYVVLTYEDQDISKGVSRTARYSRELFESAVAAISRSQSTSGFTSQNANSPIYIPPSGSTTVTRNSGVTSVAIGWQSSPASNHRSQIGSRFTYDCPANGRPSNVWGTDIYTDDSSLCTAAVHAGLITFRSGGTVTIEVRPGLEAYRGSDRNGVSTNDWNAHPGSFVFVR